jgi:hypothetical protein
MEDNLNAYDHSLHESFISQVALDELDVLLFREACTCVRTANYPDQLCVQREQTLDQSCAEEAITTGDEDAALAYAIVLRHSALQQTPMLTVPTASHRRIERGKRRSRPSVRTLTAWETRRC